MVLEEATGDHMERSLSPMNINHLLYQGLTNTNYSTLTTSIDDQETTLKKSPFKEPFKELRQDQSLGGVMVKGDHRWQYRRQFPQCIVQAYQ